MRKQKYEIERYVLTTVAVLIVSTLLCACAQGAAFNGNRIESAKFQVGIEAEGTYTLTVIGKRARGHVIVNRVGG